MNHIFADVMRKIDAEEKEGKLSRMDAAVLRSEIAARDAALSDPMTASGTDRMADEQAKQFIHSIFKKED